MLSGLAQGLALIGLVAAVTAPAAAADQDKGKAGLLVMAHGGTTAWNAAVQQAVAPLKEVCPTALALGMADRSSLQNALRELEKQSVGRAAVVRLFVSAESFRHQTEYLLGLRPDPPEIFLLHSAHHDSGLHSRPGMPRLVSSHEQHIPPVQTTISLALSQEGLYDSDLMGEVIVERVQALSRLPETESVLILAHGEGDDDINSKWLQRLDALSGKVRQRGAFRQVRVETLREDWKHKRTRAEARIRKFVLEAGRDGGRVLVVPFRVFGFGPYAKVLTGLEYSADGQGLLPHPAVTEWLRQQASQIFRQAGWDDPFGADTR